MVQKVKDNLREMRAQISIPEYLFWWATRVFMLLYIIKQFRGDHKWIDYLLPVLVGTGTFAVLLLRLVFPRKSMFGRLSFHLQTFISLMAVTGSIGNYFGLYSTNGILHYDWILHVVSGVPVTMLGYYLLVAMNGKKTRLTPQICACASMGFSFMVIIAWEIMEFCGDYLFGDNNQKYNWVDRIFRFVLYRHCAVYRFEAQREKARNKHARRQETRSCGIRKQAAVRWAAAVVSSSDYAATVCFRFWCKTAA